MTTKFSNTNKTQQPPPICRKVPPELPLSIHRYAKDLFVLALWTGPVFYGYYFSQKQLFRAKLLAQADNWSGSAGGTQFYFSINISIVPETGLLAISLSAITPRGPSGIYAWGVEIAPAPAPIRTPLLRAPELLPESVIECSVRQAFFV